MRDLTRFTSIEPERLPPKKRQRVLTNLTSPRNSGLVSSTIKNELGFTKPCANSIKANVFDSSFFKTEKHTIPKISYTGSRLFARRRQIMRKYKDLTIKFFDTLFSIGSKSYFNTTLGKEYPIFYENWIKIRSPDKNDILRMEQFTIPYLRELVKSGRYSSPLSNSEIKDLDFVFGTGSGSNENKLFVDETLFKINFDKLTHDLTRWFHCSKDMFEQALLAEPGIQNQRQQHRTYVEAFIDRANSLLTSLKAKWEKEYAKLCVEEQLDRVDKENKEPALRVWKKIPPKKRNFTMIQTYEIFPGLDQREATRIKQSFSAKDFPSKFDSNYSVWILPEGLDDKDLTNERSFVGSKKSKKRDARENNPWEPCLVGKDIDVVETWGIDCWARKNLCLALEVVPENFRLTPPQVNWFIEGLILRNVLTQEVNNAHDIGVTLNLLAAKAQQEKLNMIDSCRIRFKGRRRENNLSERELSDLYQEKFGKQTRAYRVKEEVLNETVKVYRTAMCSWKSGSILSYNEKTYKHEIFFEDGTKAWLNLSKERVNYPNLQTKSYDKEITPDMVIEAVKAILKCRKNWNINSFPLHPKGLGIVSKIELYQDEFIGYYYGQVFPPWLWQLKEISDDKKRKAKGNQLPDFWNIRYERPKSCLSGYDILYVDGKSRGSVMSRLNHSCNPNCNIIMVRDKSDNFSVAIRAARDIEDGEELTIDYNCVTDSVDEFRAAVCLCGSYACRGSFLYLTNNNQYMQVVNRRHRIGHRLAMLLEACNPISFSKLARKDSGEELERKKQLFANDLNHQNLKLIGEINLVRLLRHSIGPLVFKDFPAWLSRYLSLCLRFADIEMLELPSRLFSEDKRRRKQSHKKLNQQLNFYFNEEECFKNAKVNASGVLAQREANLVITASKIRARIESRLAAGREKKESICDSFTNLLFPENKLRKAYRRDVCKYILDDLVSLIVTSEMDYARKHFTRLAKASLTFSKPLVPVEKTSLLLQATELGRRYRYWVGDRVLARWCADDYRLYPGWYPATILAIYPSNLAMNKNYGNNNDQFIINSDVEVRKVMSEIIFKLETYDFEQENLNPLDKDQNIAINEICRKWQGPSIHILYDTGETDRIPLNQNFIHKPTVNSVQFKSGLETGLSLSTHQPPLRVLNKLELLYCFVKDSERSILSRIEVILQSKLGRFIPLWQQSIRKIRSAYGPNRHFPFWWNTKTYEIKATKPNNVLKDVVWHVPPGFEKLIKTMKKCQADNQSYEDSLDSLRLVRNKILTLPLPPLRYIKKVERDKLENELQLLCDTLTMILHTRTFFTVTEPMPINVESNNFSREGIVSALLGWIDQKEKDLELYSLTGVGFIPCVESCFNSVSTKETMIYNSHYRELLLSHLADKEQRYNSWPQGVSKCFNRNIPHLKFVLQQDLFCDKEQKTNIWPPPAPPPFLFGSPVVDAAFVDNNDLEKLSAKLTGELKDVHSKNLLDSMKKPISQRSRLIFNELIEDLRRSKRRPKHETWLDTPELTTEMQHTLEQRLSFVEGTRESIFHLDANVLNTLNTTDPVKICLNKIIQRVESFQLMLHNKEQSLFPYFFAYFKDYLNSDYTFIRQLWNSMDHRGKIIWGQQCQLRIKF